MTRRWRAVLADPAILPALHRAAIELMADVCDHEPAECLCRANLMTPVEVADWLEREVLLDAQHPLRLDHRENRKGGQKRRYGDLETASA